MAGAAVTFSDDQAAAFDALAEAMRKVGVDLEAETLLPAAEGKAQVMAVIGKAGSGKTLLLAELVTALEGLGVELVSGDWEGERRRDRRTVFQTGPPLRETLHSCRQIGSRGNI